MKCRKGKAVVWFHKPSKTTEPEKYFQHVLMLYFPWRQESDLIGPQGTYAPKLHDLSVLQTVHRNQTLLSLTAKLLMMLWNTFRITHSIPCMEKGSMYLQNKKL